MNLEQEASESTGTATYCNCAFVVRTDVETWAKIKAYAKEAGAKIVFEKAVPRKAFLWIKEE